MGTVLRRPATTPLAAAALLLLLILLFGMLLTTPWRLAEALPPASGPAVSQCNDQADAGATTTTCDITITNIITYNADGTSTTAATIVKTVDGVATTTTATAPITEIHQCNQAGMGGASTVACTSTITNMITGAPASNPAASTINQCNPAMAATTTCTATPAGPNSTGGYQSIGQCNNSGATGTVTCTATAGVASDSAPTVTIDQCNRSATMGASTLTCTATVTNTFACMGMTPLLANGACFPPGGSTSSTSIPGGSTSTTGTAPTTTVATTATTTPSTPTTGAASSPTTVSTGGGTTGTPGGATLTSSLNPTPSGQPVVFTFTVVGPASPTLGSVTFFDGSTRLSTVLLAGSQATFATSNLTAGDHDITARFTQAGSNNTSRWATIRQTVAAVVTSPASTPPRTPSGMPETGDWTGSTGLLLLLLALVTRFALSRTVGSDIGDPARREHPSGLNS